MTSVLVIDDEGDIRDVLTKVLEREGFEVKVAANGKEGLEIAGSERIDVVVTDIIMPGKDGIDTIKELRSMAPDIKIIAISGGGNIGPLAYEPTAIKTSAYLAAAEKAGAHQMFTKPFDRGELVQAIKELCET